jgi:hypothetical protein
VMFVDTFTRGYYLYMAIHSKGTDRSVKLLVK